MDIDKFMELVKEGKSLTIHNYFNPTIGLPDWGVIKHLGVIPAIDAVYLSLNLDPKAFLIGARLEMSDLEYSDRLEILNTRPDLVIEGRVDLKKFVRFALDVGWDLPPDMVRLIGEVAPDPLPTLEKAVKEYEWIIEGRKFAKEYMESFRDKPYSYGSQKAVAKKVQEHLTEIGLKTVQGKYPPVGYIVRNCIQGKFWKENNYYLQK